MFEESDLEKICEDLERQQYFIGDDLLSSDLCERLRKRALELSPNFTEAGIGRAEKHQIKSTTRSDRTQWFIGDCDIENEYLAQIEQLKQKLNRHFFLGLKRYECHFSVYEKGAFYARHVDAFAGKSNRIVTTIFYLNDAWKSEDGGELVIYDGDVAIEKVSPAFGRLVVFMSDKFPHEVLVANRERFAISGWMRNQ